MSAEERAVTFQPTLFGPDTAPNAPDVRFLPATTTHPPRLRITTPTGTATLTLTGDRDAALGQLDHIHHQVRTWSTAAQHHVEAR